jgi:serine/threonine-protein kinase RsbW
MKCYSIELPAKLESLRIAAPFTAAVLLEIPNLPDREHLIHDLALVSSEALTNAIRHGAMVDMPVSLGYSLDANGITITVTDHGSGFDLEAVALPEFDQMPEGGYGLYIMKSIMDDVRYQKSTTGNTLILTKTWKGR